MYAQEEFLALKMPHGRHQLAHDLGLRYDITIVSQDLAFGIDPHNNVGIHCVKGQDDVPV
jgi:hypothetical protein